LAYLIVNGQGRAMIEKLSMTSILLLSDSAGESRLIIQGCLSAVCRAELLINEEIRKANMVRFIIITARKLIYGFGIMLK
jgi:hypothetical protein